MAILISLRNSGLLVSWRVDRDGRDSYWIYTLLLHDELCCGVFFFVLPTYLTVEELRVTGESTQEGD
jgi:hypothetical protein